MALDAGGAPVGGGDGLEDEVSSVPATHYVTRDVTTPRGVVRVISKHWWWCVDGDATKALFYTAGRRNWFPGSPQCNTSQTIVERLRPSMPNVKAVFIETAFAPHVDER